MQTTIAGGGMRRTYRDVELLPGADVAAHLAALRAAASRFAPNAEISIIPGQYAGELRLRVCLDRNGLRGWRAMLTYKYLFGPREREV